MIKLYLISFLIISSIFVNAQVTNMIIHEVGGNTISYPLSNIDSITYSVSNSTTCPASFTDTRDGEVYTAVQIGTQCWMAQNLRYFVIGAWLNPSNPDSTYGYLYDWNTTMNGASSSATNPSGVQGICPNGWHVPSDLEWNVLEIALGMNPNDAASFAFRGTHGTDMKSITGWVSGAGTNSSGFNVLPSGIYEKNQSAFSLLGDEAFFRSATFGYNNHDIGRRLSYTNVGVGRIDNGFYYQMMDGYSCRCVKD